MTTRVEIIHERDPDSECSHIVFVDGEQVDDAHIFDIDPGRGYTADDWAEMTEHAVASASTPAVAEEVQMAYDRGGESEHIT